MMTMPTKTCSICSTVLDGQKRIKDAAGSYFCPVCWGAQAKSAKTNPPQRGSKPLEPTAAVEHITSTPDRISVERISVDAGAAAIPFASDPVSSAAPRSVQIGRGPAAAIVAFLILAIVGMSIGVSLLMRGTKDERADAKPVIAESAAGSTLSQAPVKVTPSLKDDPASSFEIFSKEFVAKGQAAAKASYSKGDAVKYGWEEPVVINVTKTDSLTSPYLGTIAGKLTTNTKMPDGFQGGNDGASNIDGHDFVVTFAAQGDHWVLKSTRAQSELARGVDTSIALKGFFEQVYAQVSH